MENLIIMDKVVALMQSATSENDKDTAKTLIEAFLKSKIVVNHLQLDVNMFLGDTAPFNSVTYDRKKKLAIASDRYSMFITPFAYSQKDAKKEPAFKYDKVLSGIKNVKAVKLIDDDELLDNIKKAEVLEVLTGDEQIVFIGSDTFLSVNNAIKMWQAGTDGWKREAPHRPLIKEFDKKIVALMPATLKQQ